MSAAKTLENLKLDPRVTDAWDEGDDGYWVSLKPGFYSALDDFGIHSVHEWNTKDLLAKMRGVKPCTCKDCLEYKPL